MTKSKNLANILRNSVNATLLSIVALAPTGCGITGNNRFPSESDIARTKYFNTEKKRELIRDIYRNPEKYMDDGYKKREKEIDSALKKYKDGRCTKEELDDFKELKKDCPCVNLKNPKKADKVMIYQFTEETLRHLFD